MLSIELPIVRALVDSGYITEEYAYRSYPELWRALAAEPS